MKFMSLIFMSLFILIGSAGISYAVPSIWGVWSWEHTEPVHVLVSPGGEGSPLSAAEFFGGAPADATIHVQLWYQGDDPENPPPPEPVINFPAEDIWLEIPGAVPCLQGAIADGPTDSDGWFTFSTPLAMGGWNDPASGTPWVYVMVVGMALEDQEHQLITPTIVVNSPDINGDLEVDLQDLTLFAQDYFGEYSFRSDFYWDGVMNLNDLALFTFHYQKDCF